MHRNEIEMKPKIKQEPIESNYNLYENSESSQNYIENQCESNNEYILHSEIKIEETQYQVCDELPRNHNPTIPTGKQQQNQPKKGKKSACNRRTKCNRKEVTSKRILQRYQLTDKEKALFLAAKRLPPNKIFQCYLCSYVGRKMWIVRKHMRIHTGGHPFKCDECPRKFNHRALLEQHKKIHKGEMPFNCDECPRKFVLKKSFIFHKRQMHNSGDWAGMRVYQCYICKKLLSSPSEVNKHMRNHVPTEKKIKCDECGKKFLDKYRLKLHKIIHTGVKEFECPFCYKRFVYKSNCDQHVRIHYRLKPYRCDQCSFATSHSSHLKRHKRTHITEDPFHCDCCLRTFRSKYSLNHHKSLQNCGHLSNQAPKGATFQCYICSYAPRRFSVNILQRHMQQHIVQGKFICDQCEKRFYEQHQLNDHQMRIHTKTEKFGCETCGKEMSSYQSLINHSHIHTGEKPFTCDKCFRSFMRKTEISRHQRKSINCKVMSQQIRELTKPCAVQLKRL